MRVSIALVGLVLPLLAAGCMGESQTYGEGETIAAFERVGISLSENTRPERSGEFLSPDPAIYVLVGTTSEADDLWSAEDLNPVARRANVVVVAVSEDFAARDEQRVVRALEALPESESAVQVANG